MFSNIQYKMTDSLKTESLKTLTNEEKKVWDKSIQHKNKMKTIIALACVLVACNAITNPPMTGTTPPAIDCPNTLCNGKSDGNYAIGSYLNYFTQCIANNLLST